MHEDAVHAVKVTYLICWIVKSWVNNGCLTDDNSHEVSPPEHAILWLCRPIQTRLCCEHQQMHLVSRVGSKGEVS